MDNSELLEHLKEQIYFIEKSIENYEQNEIEAKRVATHIRTLVHDTANSVSLLNMLNLKSILFLNTNAPRKSFSNWNSKNVAISVDLSQKTPYVGIVGKEVIGHLDGTISIKYFPIYKLWQNYSIKINFENWWNEDIYDNGNGEILTRKGLILNVANKDGGAHIDNLKQEYKSFKKNDVLSFVVNNNLQGSDNIPAYPAVMQIGWELVNSIKQELII